MRRPCSVSVEHLCRLAMAAVNRVGGLAAGIVNAIFVRFYQYVVDPAEADTWPFRLFAYLAKGFIRWGYMIAHCSYIGPA